MVSNGKTVRENSDSFISRFPQSLYPAISERIADVIDRAISDNVDNAFGPQRNSAAHWPEYYKGFFNMNNISVERARGVIGRRNQLHIRALNPPLSLSDVYGLPAPAFLSSLITPEWLLFSAHARASRPRASLTSIRAPLLSSMRTISVRPRAAA
jgi:hypothetical protein